MKLKKIIAGHLIVLGLIFPNAVSAEQFTFNVGVNFSNIHEDVDKVRVSCHLKPSLTSSNTDAVGTSIGIVSVPANGTLNTTIQLKLNANPGINPADVKAYRCFLSAVTRNGTISAVSAANDPRCNNSINDPFCAKPGATFSGSVLDGSIP